MVTPKPTKKTVMEIRCVYCDKYMGEKDGKGVKGVTTGICEECWKKNFPQWPYPRKEE